MGLYDHWPYTNFHELNLSWLLRRMEDLSNVVENFVALNTIKYADPIQWNITTQYEANTVVVDPQTGTAYLSTRPVPAGVAISNTDYWSVIFTLDFDSTNNNITLRNDGTNTAATFDSPENSWLLLNGVLYKTIRDIEISDAYLIGYNIERYTVELFIADAIRELSDTIGDLDNLSTEDKSSLVNAINELITIVGRLADLTTEDKTSIVDAINSLNEKVDNLVGFVDLTKYAVSGSANEFNGSINVNANLLQLSGAHDFNVGYGLLIERAGDTPTLTPVSTFTAVYTGAAGTNSYEYAIAKITNKFGVTPVTTATVTNCQPLDKDNYVTLSFNQDPNAYAYIIYRNNVLVDIISHTITNSLIDWQQTAITVPFNIPSTPPAAYVNEYLKTKVDSISGNNITIADNALNTVLGARVIHDDTDEIQKAINENELLYIPKGHYNVSITAGTYCLSIPSNREIYGDGELSVIYSNFGIAHGAILFNSCNVYGGTNRDITIRKLKIDTGAINTDRVSGISYRTPAVYMAANDPTDKPKRITVKDMVINGVSGGITFASIVEGVISHNSITNVIADGCGCYDACENCVIEYNTIYNTGDDCIGVSNSTNTYYNMNIKCVGNSCTRTGAHGIRVEGSGISIMNNAIEYTALDGILIHKYDQTLTQLITIIGNRCTRVHTYDHGIAGNVSGTFYDIASRDDDGAGAYGFLSQVAIIGNNLNDTDSIGIIGINPSNPITNIQIAGNPTVAGGVYDINGVIPPNNIHSFSQKYTGTFSVDAASGTPVSYTITYPDMPLIPDVIVNRLNGTGGKFNYWFTSITKTSATVVIVAEDTATYNFNYIAEC